MSMIGKSLAHYQITTLIGKGGMGEVYQAKDSRLGRDVAIKVLPEEFAKDPDRVARFQREAKLLASLNHPNIAAIYGLEKSDDTHFLVMELIEGNTIAERIKSGPVPVEEALKLGLQITEALEAAHEKGVIHRDLKPANIKVTPDGKVKVLDFGLAKAFVGELSDMNLSNSPTLSDAATMQGVILGTAAYMSPEQARGKPVDKRADIWAFGVVLFEMLTGKAAFQGKDVTDTLAAVIRSEPEWSSLPVNLHWRLREVLERCLEKEVKDRCSGISDARVDIQKVLADPGGVLAQPITAAERRKRPGTVLLWAAATLILIAIAGFSVWYLRAPEPPQVTRSDYELPEGQQFYRDPVRRAIHLAVSPDGSRFAYSTTKGIYIRSMNELDARLISGTDEDAQSLFFSPDGQWIGYFALSVEKLRKISINGGAPADLCDAVTVFGATWHEDNTIVYSDVLSGTFRVSANGGTPEPLVKGITALANLLPGGKSVMFIDGTGRPYKTVVQSLESGERKVVFDGGGGTYLSTGHFVYEAEGSLFAVPFDLDKLEFAGGPVSVMEAGMFGAFSDSGTYVYVPRTAGAGGSAAPPKRTLVWVDRGGKEEPLGAEPNDYRQCRISPDGTKVALTVRIDGNRDIRIWDTVRKNLMRLTFNEAADINPLWTPDGQRVVFNSNSGGASSIFGKKADGTGEVEKIGSAPDRMLFPWSWSGDGNTLVLSEFSFAPPGMDIGTLSMEGDRQRKGLLQEEHAETDPRVSPDGRWMAYATNESGREEIYVRPFPDAESGGRWQVSTDGGNSPLWSPEGRELFYRNGDAAMAVPVETDPAFSPGNPELLFRGTYYINDIPSLQITLTPWDIHPDGRRFLMIKPAAETGGESPAESATEGPRKIIIVTNWFEELKQKAPVN
jgi:serine/threonine protein kinase